MAVVAAGVLLLIGSPAGATTFVVDSTLDEIDANIGDGVCGTTAGACTLRAAVNEANDASSADTIVLPAGTYTLTIPPDDVPSTSLSGDLDVWHPLTIRGAGADVTVIDANHLDRAFELVFVGTPGRLQLRDVSVINGAPPENHAGGILSRNGDLRLVRTVVAGNQALVGGGIEILGGRALLVQSRVSDNVGNAGAGIRAIVSGRVQLRRSTVSANRTPGSQMSGAGIACFPGTELLLSQSVVSDNRSTGGGGGIAFGGVRARITGSSLQGNEAAFGGGLVMLQLDAASPPPGPVAIADSQITANVADSGGGGLWITPSGTPPLIKRTSIVANDDRSGRGPDCLGEFVDGGNTTVGDPTGCVIH